MEAKEKKRYKVKGKSKKHGIETLRLLQQKRAREMYKSNKYSIADITKEIRVKRKTLYEWIRGWQKNLSVDNKTTPPLNTEATKNKDHFIENNPLNYLEDNNFRVNLSRDLDKIDNIEELKRHETRLVKKQILEKKSFIKTIQEEVALKVNDYQLKYNTFIENTKQLDLQIEKGILLKESLDAIHIIKQKIQNFIEKRPSDYNLQDLIKVSELHLKILQLTGYLTDNTDHSKHIHFYFGKKNDDEVITKTMQGKNIDLGNQIMSNSLPQDIEKDDDLDSDEKLTTEPTKELTKDIN